MAIPRITRKCEAAIEANFKNQTEAFELLKLVSAEFQSDPKAVQCFDLRIVERVKECVEKRKRFEKEFPLFK